MKLIYIKSTITPKDYSVVREILKKERGEKLAPFIYKLSKLESLEKYLSKENINYEVYQEEKSPLSLNKNSKKTITKSKLKEDYKDFAKNEKLKKRLIAGYKASAKSKKLAQEDKIWEEAISDGLEKNE